MDKSPKNCKQNIAKLPSKKDAFLLLIKDEIVYGFSITIWKSKIIIALSGLLILLWPFFGIRIPGLKQPAIQEILRNENIETDNDVELLKRFGQKTISNPYELHQKTA